MRTTTWRPLDAYSPFARCLVDYMWSQRPPLVPSHFARALGIPKQQVARWLATAAVPEPTVLMRLARGMRLPVRDLFLLAGYATADDPLLDRLDACRYVAAQLEEQPPFRQAPPEIQQLVRNLLHGLAQHESELTL